jgi:hypothetical protein
VLLLHLWFDMCLCVFVHRWTLMKIIGLFFVNHRFTWIARTIHNLHYVPISLGTFAMNPLKFGLGTTFFAITLFSFHHITLWKSMSFDCMSHITIIIVLYSKLNHTRGKASSSIRNVFHMIEHELTCFKITPKLHPFHQITTITIVFYTHLEKEHAFFLQTFV